MLHRASRDRGQGRQIFSANNSSQLVAVGRRLADTARTVAGGTAPSSPLNTTVSGNRRFTVAGRALEEYRLVRACYNCDVNDVVLAVVAGALRNWLLLSRGAPATPTSTVRGRRRCRCIAASNCSSTRAPSRPSATSRRRMLATRRLGRSWRGASTGCRSGDGAARARGCGCGSS